MKESLKELPQIDAVLEHNRSPEYANQLLDDLLRFFTLTEISAHTGICRRNLSYMRHNGINTYPMQVVMEILAGYKVLDAGKIQM